MTRQPKERKHLEGLSRWETGHHSEKPDQGYGKQEVVLAQRKIKSDEFQGVIQVSYLIFYSRPFSSCKSKGAGHFRARADTNSGT